MLIFGIWICMEGGAIELMLGPLEDTGYLRGRPRLTRSSQRSGPLPTSTRYQCMSDWEARMSTYQRMHKKTRQDS